MSVPHALSRSPLYRATNPAGPRDLGWTHFLELTDHYPHWRVRATSAALPLVPLVPAECSIRLSVEGGSWANVVAQGPSYVLLLSTVNGHTAVIVAAADDECGRTVLDSVLAADTEERPGEVPLSLWRLTSNGAQQLHRDIAAPDWASVERNYSIEVAAALDGLMRLRDVPGTARLMVWSGEPGTGKTSALRALMREWQPWCASHLVVDPERLFDDAAYLVEVMTAPGITSAVAGLTSLQKRRRDWNLVICEDADAFLRTRGRSNPGAGIGRLLNLADGLLGQGSRTLVLLTANLPDREIDRAILRPGRCLAHVEFGRFGVTESRDWLRDPAASIPLEGMTLAELYERSGHGARHVSRAAREELSFGAYL